MIHIDMSQSAKSYFRTRRSDPFPFLLFFFLQCTFLEIIVSAFWRRVVFQSPNRVFSALGIGNLHSCALSRRKKICETPKALRSTVQSAFLCNISGRGFSESRLFFDCVASSAGEATGGRPATAWPTWPSATWPARGTAARRAAATSPCRSCSTGGQVAACRGGGWKILFFCCILKQCSVVRLLREWIAFFQILSTWVSSDRAGVPFGQLVGRMLNLFRLVF